MMTGAAIAWATADAIYCEIPCKDGPPYIVAYPRNVAGLGQAFNILVKHQAPSYSRGSQAGHPAIKTGDVAKAAAGKPVKPKPGTPEQRARAAEVVKRMFGK